MILLAVFPCISSVLADARSASIPSSATPLGYPLKHECVVTVDSLAVVKPAVAGGANIVTGFVAPDTVRGTLVRIDAEWLVLQDGCNENWIPRAKVMMIHFCD